MEYCHNKFSKCPPCSVLHNASFLNRDPRVRHQGVLGHMFVRIFLFCPWNTYLNYGLFFKNTLYNAVQYFISKNTLLEAGRYKNPYFVQILVIVHTVHSVLHYPFIYQLPCTTLCFVSHILVPSDTRLGVC